MNQLRYLPQNESERINAEIREYAEQH